MSKEIQEHPLLSMFLQQGFERSSIVTGFLYPTRNEREPEVWESDEWFWCVIIDQRQEFSDSLRIEKLRPYRWTGNVGNGEETAYGWVDAGGNTVYNLHASVSPDDDYQVVACKKIV